MTVNPILSAYVSQVQGTPEAKTGKPEGKKAAAPQGEKVQLSDASKSAQSVRDAVRKMPDTRVELVVEIKRKVTSGTYPLASSLNAAIDRMIREKVLA
jgi:flagellar biosynthesis anti-sigma factor FlgM